jgi:hypothetical protein
MQQPRVSSFDGAHARSNPARGESAIANIAATPDTTRRPKAQ